MTALKRQKIVDSAAQLPPGMEAAAAIMTPEYEREIIAFIDQLELDPAPRPDAGERAIAAFGWGYDPKTYDLVPAAPLPVELEPLRAVAGEFAGVDPEELEHCMVSRFGAGAMIPWLRMRPMWKHLVGITLGSETPIRFRKETGGTEEVLDISLPPRSMYLLTGESRYDYDHSFPATGAGRWCLWFRNFSDEGIRMSERFRVR